MLLRARVENIGVNPYVPLTARQAWELGADQRGPVPVRFRIGMRSGSLWRVNLMPVRDGTYRLYLNGVIRKACDIDVGDLVTVDVEFDDEYRKGPQHPMPVWFGEGLERNPDAMGGWQRLPPGRQKEILRYFARLRSDEAKRRNLEKALCVLAGGKARFMGRSWDQGR